MDDGTGRELENEESGGVSLEVHEAERARSAPAPYMYPHVSEWPMIPAPGGAGEAAPEVVPLVLAGPGAIRHEPDPGAQLVEDAAPPPLPKKPPSASPGPAERKPRGTFERLTDRQVAGLLDGMGRYIEQLEEAKDWVRELTAALREEQRLRAGEADLDAMRARVAEVLGIPVPVPRPDRAGAPPEELRDGAKKWGRGVRRPPHPATEMKLVRRFAERGAPSSNKPNGWEVRKVELRCPKCGRVEERLASDYAKRVRICSGKGDAAWQMRESGES
jgi:hypothetical protein